MILYQGHMFLVFYWAVYNKEYTIYNLIFFEKYLIFNNSLIFHVICQLL